MSIRKQVSTGISWTGLSMLVVTVSQFVQILLLARIFSPEEFGAAALLIIILGLPQILAEGGLANSIIQNQNTSTKQLSSLYWLGVLFGAAFSGLIYFTAPITEGYFLQDGAGWDTAVKTISLCFLINAFGNHYRSLYQKSLSYGVPAVAEIIGSISKFIITIALAYKGAGVYSVAVGYLAYSILVNGIITHYGRAKFYRPSFALNLAGIQSHIRFGLYDVGTKGVNFLSSHLDKLLIGRMVGLTALGQYHLAWQFVIFPLTKINPILDRVAFPIYAQQQNHSSDLQRSYVYTVLAAITLSIPLLSFLSIFANEVILVLYGSSWQSTSKVMQILVYVGILKLVANPGGNLLLALGRSDICFWWNIAWCVIVALFFYVALKFYPVTTSPAWVLLALSLTVGNIWHLIIIKVARINYTRIILHSTTLLLTTHSLAWLCKVITLRVTTIENIYNLTAVAIVYCGLCVTLYYLFFTRVLMRNGAH
jgi:O-antigen/teichoic acid export membrane protein